MRVRTANVRTKSVYEAADPADGRRVLTTQYWPRGVSKLAVDEYVRKLAPSRQLLHAFKQDHIDWLAFKARYLQEMEDEDAKGEIHHLAKAARSEPITVMCVCKSEEACHRSLLRDLIINFDEGPSKLI